MEIRPVFLQLPRFKSEGEEVDAQKQKKENLCKVSAAKDDMYDLGLVVREGKYAASQMGPSWPNNCDTANSCSYGGCGTWTVSCVGTCGTCSNC